MDTLKVIMCCCFDPLQPGAVYASAVCTLVTPSANANAAVAGEMLRSRTVSTSHLHSRRHQIPVVYPKGLSMNGLTFFNSKKHALRMCLAWGRGLEPRLHGSTAAGLSRPWLKIWHYTSQYIIDCIVPICHSFPSSHP